MDLLNCALIKNNEIVNVIVVSSEATPAELTALAVANGADTAELATDDKMVLGAKKVSGDWVMPKPWPSYILDENGYWTAPVPLPTIGGPYFWNESDLRWEPVDK